MRLALAWLVALGACVPDVRLYLADDARAAADADATVAGDVVGGVDAPGDDGFTIDLPPGPTAACAAEETGLRRECGWTRGGVFSCAPGSSVTLGCDQFCAPALGRCVGDTILRVCDGVAHCAAVEALAQHDDDGCTPPAGKVILCSRASFTCPSSGRVTALVGPSTSGRSFTCDLAALGATRL